MRRLLRAVSLVVTDRRWAAPLSALALGFGLFVGVAIGPNAAGSLATGGAQIIEIPGLGGVVGGGDGGDGGGGSSASLAGPAAGAAGGEGGAIPSSGSALPSFAPIAAGDSGFAETTPPTEPPSSDTESSEQTGPELAIADAVAVTQPDTPTASECADLTAILVQIYVEDPVGLPYGDSAGLQAALCPLD